MSVQAWLAAHPRVRGVLRAGAVPGDFAQHYLAVRAAEGRVHDDAVVAQLPELPATHAHAAEWRLRAASARRLIDHLRAQRPGAVLELGCGNGWLAARMARDLGATVVGVDVNAPELEQGARVFAAQANLHFALGDVFVLCADPALTGAFDAIVIASALQYFADPAELVHALRKLLSARGEIHIIDTALHAEPDAAAAAARTREYYAALGHPDAARHYHAHLRAPLLALGARVLHDPRTPGARLRRWRGEAVSPFPWIVMGGGGPKGAGPDPQPTPDGHVLATMTRIALAGVVLLSAVRLKWTLIERPVPPIYADYVDVQLFAADIAMLLALAGALPRGGVRLWPRSLALPLALLALAIGVSVIGALDPALAALHAARVGLCAALSLVVAARHPAVLQPALCLMLIVQGAIAVAQSVLQRSLGLAGLGEHTLDPAWRGVSVVMLEGARVLRAYGLSDHPNLLAGALMAALLLLAVNWPPAGLWRALMTPAVALGVAGLYLSYSRAAWLGALAGGAALLWMWRLQPRPARLPRAPLIGGAVALAGCVALSAGVMLARVDTFSTTERAAGLLERAYLNAATLDILAAHPLAGVGLNNLVLAERARWPDFPLSYQPAHNTVLTAAAETGVAGALAWLLACIWPLAAAWRARARMTPALAGSSAALLAFGVAGLFDFYPWTWTTGRIWQWLIWGAWSAAWRDTPLT